MRLVDFTTDDKTRQAETAAEKIAKGVSKTAMLLPDLEIRTAIEPYTPESAVNSIMSDYDVDDVAADKRVGYDLNSAFEYHKNPVRAKRPQQPSAPIGKLPTPKRKAVAATKPDTFTDKQGNDYEYLGMFDGDLSFLDEKYKGVTVNRGQHLYRKPTGITFENELAEYEYFVGDDPETSAIFGKIFKGIGKAIKKVGKGIGKAGKFYFNKVMKPMAKVGLKAAPFVIPGAAVFAPITNKVSDAIPYNIKNQRKAFDAQIRNELFGPKNSTLGTTGIHTIKSLDSDGETYEYVGRHDGDLSFLDEVEPGVIVPPGAFIYRKPTGLSFSGEPEYEYFMGGHPEQAEFIGKALKKIGKAVGKGVKAVGKGVANAAKWTGKTVAKGVKATGKGIGNAAKWTVNKGIPGLVGVLTGQQQADASNGVVGKYNPFDIGDFGNNGGGGGFYDEDGNYNPQSVSEASENDGTADTPKPEPKPSNKTTIYIIAALAVVGLFIYFNKK